MQNQTFTINIQAFIYLIVKTIHQQRVVETATHLLPEMPFGDLSKF